MYLPRNPFSPMSNGFESLCRKNHLIILWVFLQRILISKQMVPATLFSFLLRIQKKAPWKIFTWFFYIIVQEKILDIGLLCHRITLRFFFKFVSRTNCSNSYPPTKRLKNQKYLALEKFLEQTTLKPCNFWAWEALEARMRDCLHITMAQKCHSAIS